jgi:hypothetical protein
VVVRRSARQRCWPTLTLLDGMERHACSKRDQGWALGIQCVTSAAVQLTAYNRDSVPGCGCNRVQGVCCGLCT